MGKKQRFIKLFVVLFFSTAFIFSFSHFGVKAFEKIINSDGKYAKGTSVGSIDLSGKTNREAVRLVEEKYVDWVKNTKMELQYSEKTVPFDLNLFHFNAEETVNKIKDGQENDAFITIEQSLVQEQIKILFPQLESPEIDFSKLTTNLIKTASQLHNGSFQFILNKDYLQAGNNKEVVISEARMEINNFPDGLEAFIKANSEIKISEEATFSLHEFATNNEITQSTALNIIATGLYQAILPTNFSIAERNISSALPDYANPGYEAYVNLIKGADFVIVNPNKVPYIIELKLENNNLIVSLKGQRLLYNYKISKKEEQQIKPKTIVQYSPHVIPGKTIVKTEGTNGLTVKIYRDSYQGDQLVKSELIAEDYYAPVYRVEIQGLVDPAKTNGAQSSDNGATSGTDETGSQTAAPADQMNQGTENEGLWGKPNELPK